MEVKVLGKLNRDEKFIMGGEFYIFFLIGLYTLMVGALVPQMRSEYGISYELSGYLISANSIGMIAMNLIASYAAILFGLKRAYIMLHALVIIGLITMTISGSPVVLLLGMTFIGFARGSTSTYSNQIVNDITKSSTRFMNLSGVFFSIGACVAPFIMLFASDITGGWRYVCYGVSAAAVIGILLTLFMKLGNEAIGTVGAKRSDLSFFKNKKFWVTLIALFCYSGTEISIIGWIVTFFIEAQNTTAQFASAMATLLWGSMLAGRIVCSLIANRMAASRLVLYLSIGAAVFMVLFVSKVNLSLQIAATIGLGLFMSGTYSTIIADAGHILSEYKLALGYFFMLSGLGPVIMPAIIGLISERYGIRIGIWIIAVAAAALLVISILNIKFDKKAENGNQMTRLPE